MDQKFMQLALDLAVKAKGKTSPNPMVGAVVVKDGKIVGQGYHQKAGTPHAEIHALREAGIQARGATVYVTLEPCSHFGRTPPCAEALIKAGVRRVVAAMVDPNPLVAGRGLARLREAGILTEMGLLEDEAKKLNEVFIKYITTNRPFVVFKTAMTLDGKIATVDGHSRWVTGQESRQRVHQLRNEYDAIMVGIGTLLADDPVLTTRLPDEEGRDAVRIIVDSQARTPLTARVLTQDSDAPTIIVALDSAPVERVRALRQAGAQVLQITGKPGISGVPIHKMLHRLGKEGISSIFLEGGGQLAASFFTAGLVDKLYWFIAPKIVGGTTAPVPVAGTGIKLMDQAVIINDMEIHRFGDDILLKGYPVYNDRLVPLPLRPN